MNDIVKSAEKPFVSGVREFAIKPSSKSFREFAKEPFCKILSNLATHTAFYPNHFVDPVTADLIASRYLMTRKVNTNPVMRQTNVLLKKDYIKLHEFENCIYKVTSLYPNCYENFFYPLCLPMVYQLDQLNKIKPATNLHKQKLAIFFKGEDDLQELIFYYNRHKKYYSNFDVPILVEINSDPPVARVKIEQAFRDTGIVYFMRVNPNTGIGIKALIVLLEICA